MIMETKSELANAEQLCILTSAAAATTDSQKAWHISALLLSLRRPARPDELAFLCTLFHATPELIEFLCFIPDSPLYLTPSRFVTFSSIGYFAMAEFVANSNVASDFQLRFQFPEGIELGLKTYFRKRKRIGLEEECLQEKKRRACGDNEVVIRNNYAEAYFPVGNTNKDIRVQSSEPHIVAFDAHQLERSMFRTSLFVSNSNVLSKLVSSEKETPFPIERNELNYSLTTGLKFGSLDSFRHQKFWPSISQHEELMSDLYQEKNHLRTQENPLLSTKDRMNEEILARKISFPGPSKLKLKEHMEYPTNKTDTVVYPGKTAVEGLKIVESNQEEQYRGYFGNLLIDMTRTDISKKDSQVENAMEEFNQTIPAMDDERGREPLNNRATLTANFLSLGQSQLAKTSHKSKVDQKQLHQKVYSTDRTLQNVNAVFSPLRQLQTKRDKKSIPSKQHSRDTVGWRTGAKEKQETADKTGKNSFTSSSHEQRVLPKFESFIVEEEEGSGGYGTVYRARRKGDGATFAIKCPHVNANRNHVHNEVKMLERFGGKNFVIRYEGTFKSGNSDCLVLEHVEHDRPEVLKKDMDACELQWYGYCMFRALAGLHKQGIVHRDVKPGNFLFNRKACKGYLIDFNLAMDLNQKYSTIDKTKVGQDVSLDHVLLPSTKPLPPSKFRKILSRQDAKIAHLEQGNLPKTPKNYKDTRKKIGKSYPHAEIRNRGSGKSQGADGSGVTSAKDATSTKPPFTETFREPLPCQGRKELINLVQEALQCASREAVNIPVSKRKRIAAPPGKVDHKFVHMTPMPLHSAGGDGGAGLLKSKGDGKIKREGPCVGTKGFRAPEVLFRSLYQGPKVDIWSAGVTLLCLTIGRTPFSGDPDQNAQEIAKLRGSEDLWEVAKLHNRESSFPVELFDIKSLPSMKLQDWCKQNTRRSNFLEVIPRSFFDLVDKCLTVNPRMRISAEEALRHEFFSPCHDALRKHRLLRQGVVSHLAPPTSSLPLHDGQSQTSAEVSWRKNRHSRHGEKLEPTNPACDADFQGQHSFEPSGVRGMG